MFYVYLLKSKLNGEVYIGSTNDLKRRIKEHNDGKSSSTKRYLPWNLEYYEAYKDEKFARLREQRLKYNGNAVRELKKRIGWIKSGAGFTLIEIVVSIVLLAALFAGMSLSLQSLRTSRRATHTREAARYGASILEAVRGLPFSSLTNRAAAEVIGMPVNVGTIKVLNDATARSAPNVLDMTATSATSSFGSAAFVSGQTHADFTWRAAVRVPVGSPPGWWQGLAFRHQDAENGYLLHLDVNQLSIIRRVAGVETALGSAAVSSSPGAWYLLQVTTSGNSITGTLDGGSPVSASDATFVTGAVGTVSKTGVSLQVDDATLTETGGGGTWNFDGESVGSFPSGWLATPSPGLPSAAGTITITNVDPGGTLKEITARVDWKESGLDRSISFKTYRSQDYGD